MYTYYTTCTDTVLAHIGIYIYLLALGELGIERERERRGADTRQVPRARERADPFTLAP